MQYEPMNQEEKVAIIGQLMIDLTDTTKETLALETALKRMAHTFSEAARLIERLTNNRPAEEGIRSALTLVPSGEKVLETFDRYEVAKRRVRELEQQKEQLLG